MTNEDYKRTLKEIGLYEPTETKSGPKDLKNIKYVLDECLKHDKGLSDETIAYCKGDYPRGFEKKFDKCFAEVMGRYCGFDAPEDANVPATADKAHFESYFKFVSYKGLIFAFRLMYGQGSASDIWVLDIGKAHYDWIGDRNAYNAWKKCIGRFGSKEVLQKEKLGPQECNGDPNDIESYGRQVLEHEIAVYGLMTNEVICREVLKHTEKSPDKFIRFALENMPRHQLIEFLKRYK